MPIIEVKGLGKVSIAGDRPTEAERRNMLIELGRRRDAADAAPPTTQPDQPDAPSGLTRALATGVLDLPRGVAQTGVAAMEAVGVDGPGFMEESAVRQARTDDAADATMLSMMGDAPMFAPRMPRKETVESAVSGIESAQRAIYKPTLEGSGVDALKALGEGRVGDFMSWMGESTARALPGIGLAVANLPASVATVVGDIAKERAANRGDTDVSPSDFVVALGAGTGSQYLDRIVGRTAVGTGSVPKTIATGALTEGASGAIEKVGGQLLTREGDDYILGVSPADVGEAALTEAMVGGGITAGVRGAAELARLPSERQVSRLERELEAIEKRQAAEQPPAEPVVEEVAEEVVTPAEERRPWQTPKGEFVRENTNWDPNEGYDRFNPARKEGAGLRDYVQKHVSSKNIRHSVSFTHFPPRSWVDLGDGLVLADDGSGYRKFYILKNTEVGRPTPSMPAGRRKGDIVGLLAFETDGSGGVAHFVLSPELRGKGYGDALLSAATDAGLDVTKAKLRTKHFSSAIHRFAVKRALDAGEPVPAEVLKDYPDLAATQAEEVAETALPVAEEVTPPEAEALVAEGRRQRRLERAARREAAKLREEIAPRPRGEMVGGQEVVAEVDPGVGLQQLKAASLDPAASDAEVEAVLARAAVQEEGAQASRKVDYEDDLRAALEAQGVDYDKLTGQQRMGYNDMVNMLDARDLRSTIDYTDDGVPTLNQPPALQALVAETAAGNRRSLNASEVLALNNARATARRAQSKIKELVSRADVTEDQIAAASKLLDKAEHADIQATLGLRFGAGEVGRAMRAMQFVVREDLTLADAKASAVMRRKRSLSAEEDAKIERLWAAAEAKEARADKAHKASIAALKKAISAYEKATPAKKAAANKRVLKARDNVVKAKRAAQGARLDKAAVSKEVVEPSFYGPYRKVFGAGIALSSAGDASALGRQAIFLAMQNPVEALKTSKWMFNAAPWRPGHREFARKEMEDMLASRAGKLFTRAGGELTEVEGLSNRPDSGPLDAREEAFMFRVLESGWLGDNVVVPSQNIFALTLNRMRLANFSKGVEILSDELGGADKVSRRDAEGLARLINVSTGRGEWNPGNSLGVARHFMFAPRFTMSRVENLYRAGQLLTGRGDWVKGLSPEARRLYGNRVARNMGFAMGLAMLAAYASSDSPEEARERIDDFYDPGSADFLKMRVGDTHIDLLGGTSATVRYLLPVTFRPTEADNWDNPLSSKGIQGYLFGLKQLGNNKLAPLYQAVREIAFGLDWRGRGLDELPKEDDVGRVMEDWFGGGERETGVAGGGRYAAEAPVPQTGHARVMDGALAYALNRFVFPAMGMVTPITLKNAASEFVREASDSDKKLIEDRLGGIIAETFGIGVSQYKPTKRSKASVPGVPRVPSMPRMERW